MAAVPAGPLASGSVSLRLYAETGDAVAILDELRAQAALAVGSGFDGVMVSEHHAGFAGYVPNPLQVAGFLLEAMPSGWAAACPVLVTLRPAAVVAEEAAWLAARFPNRVGLGLAAGALAIDFDVMDTTMDDLTPRFRDGLRRVTSLLGGRDDGPLASDPALARCRTHPVPVVSAAASPTAARRAAELGAGVLLDSLVTVDRARVLTDAYREAGGDRPIVLVRRAWLGAPPMELFERQQGVYEDYAPGAATAHWGADELVRDTDEHALGDALVDVVKRAGADALNLRVHVPGVAPAAVREQIERLGPLAQRIALTATAPPAETPRRRDAETARRRDAETARRRDEGMTG